MAIDFDASVEQGQPIGHKFSSGYCPPEARLTDGESVQLEAHTSFDVWSFGIVAFRLIKDVGLFKTDGSDNIDVADLERFGKKCFLSTRPCG